VAYDFLTKEEQKEIKKTIQTGTDADRILKDFTSQVSNNADQSLILLKSLDRDKTSK
jgi:hypothetical protein